jgi:O-acetyl-ADP-ribose deacetylase (regulator of RNase III)
MPTLQAIQADITSLTIDAIVEECESLNGCKAGQGKVSDGIGLKARFVIRTVGPVWQGGQQGEAELLISCYRQCIELAEQYNISSIAFPAISTGVYGYPKQAATEIAVATVSEAVEGTAVIGEVVFCCYSASDLKQYRAVLMQPT